MAGNRDFGRCPLASRIPPALWPVGEKPALQHVLDSIYKQGIKSAVICSNGQRSLFQRAVANTDFPKLEFLEEPLPSGPAGCIRDAAEQASEELFLVLPGQMFLLPDLGDLIKAHLRSNAALTIIHSSGNDDKAGNNTTCEMYLCNRTVLEQIPRRGYFDIKEGLIPALLKADRTIRAVNMPEKIPGIFRNRREYLKAIEEYMPVCKMHNEFPLRTIKGERVNIRISNNVRIDSSVIIQGSVFILNNTVISGNALLFGPAIIGPDAIIGSDSIIQNSVLWRGVQVGKKCNIADCVVDHDIKIADGRAVKNEAVVNNTCHHVRNIKHSSISFITHRIFKIKQRVTS